MHAPRLARRLLTITGVFLLAACQADTTRYPIAPEALLAKGGPKSELVTVSQADPASGVQGAQRIQVRVLGSNFNASARAIWQRDGVEDPKITVHSTTFISASEVVAEISIAVGADTVLYDVAVEITMADGGRKKGVGVELFEVVVLRGPVADVPYYVTAWGGLVTSPDPLDPSVGQEQLHYAWQEQIGHFNVNTQIAHPNAAPVHAQFVLSKSNSASCKKGHHRTPDAYATALVEELTSADNTPHGFRVSIDSVAYLGEGSGEVAMHYQTSPGSPFYPNIVRVTVLYMSKTSPENGYPRVTVVTRVGDETVYRFHAGYGSVRVQGGDGLISCALMDDVYIRVRPGF